MKVRESGLSFEIRMDDIQPWHFLDPFLYRIDLAIGYKTQLTDHGSESFGFRELRTSGQELVFNGEPVRLPGLEWMPGSDPKQGMAEDTATMKRMLELLRGTGAVLTRFHWQQHPFILDWCDRNGILVQEEIPLWQAPLPDQLNDSLVFIVDRHIEEMIHAHRNHPSIVAWGIGNELAGQDPEMKAFLRKIYMKIRQLDSTRLINYVSNTFHQDPGEDATRIGDVMMWNDYSGLWYDRGEPGFPKDKMPGFLDRVATEITGKPLIISEYGLCEPAFEGGDPRRIELMRSHTRQYDQRAFITGNIYFSLNDYRTHMGEEGKGRLRQRVHGLTDLQGRKKPSYDVLAGLYMPVRDLSGSFIGEDFHVTGKNYDGLPGYTLYNCHVEVFDRAGRLLGEKQMPPVQPGTSFNVVFRNAPEEIFSIRIITGTGFIAGKTVL